MRGIILEHRLVAYCGQEQEGGAEVYKRRTHLWDAGWVLATGRGMAEEGVRGMYSFCCCERVAKSMAGVVPVFSSEYTTGVQGCEASGAEVRSPV